MPLPSPESSRQPTIGAATAEAALTRGDLCRQKQLRSGQRRGRREIKTLRRRSKRRLRNASMQ